MAENKPLAAAVAAKQAEEVQAPVVHVIVPTVKIEGVSTRQVWKFKVVDFAKLPDEYKLANEAELGRIARTFHDSEPVPGVAFFAESILAGR